MELKQMETTRVVVGGIQYYIKPFPAFKAANLSGELASVLTPLFAAIAPLLGDDDDLGDVDANKAASSLSAVAIDGDKVEKMMRKLLLGGHIAAEVEDEDGETSAEVLDLDLANELFCGEVQDMFVLCFHVIRINFNGFFKKFAALSGTAKEKAAKKMRKIL